MKYIDMHTHTTASDGAFTPRQLIEYALQKHLSGIAITDHDTVEGIEEAVTYCCKLNSFIVIAGIELSAEAFDEEIHILGYDINYKSKELLNILDSIKNQRINRAIKIIKKLQNLNVFITYNEVSKICQAGVIGRPHIGKILIQKGYAKNMEEAFVKYLNKGSSAYVPRYKLTPCQAIDVIKKAGGKVVLAHPGLIKNKKIINYILKKGIDGIEVYHPEHTKEDNKKFLFIAKENNLVITAGSDFHSPPVYDKRHGDLGSQKISKTYIANFIRGISR